MRSDVFPSPHAPEEQARRAIRVFLLVWELILCLSGESQLPLTDYGTCVQVDNVLDLNNSDLIACTVVGPDSTKFRRFLVTDNSKFILVQPDSRRLGWGVAKMTGFLQDIEVQGDKDDSRCLHMTINHTTSGPLVAARFISDDHIRCLAAKQRGKVLCQCRLRHKPLLHRPVKQMKIQRTSFTKSKRRKGKVIAAQLAVKKISQPPVVAAQSAVIRVSEPRKTQSNS